MRSRPRAQLDVAVLVDSMFGEVFTVEERVDLLTWIRAWEAENPGVTAADRVTGWIDVAYSFQEREVSQSSLRPHVTPPRPAPEPAI